MPRVDPELDSRYMQLALLLAAATVGLTSPNPQVGCILTHGTEVIGEGAHLYAGRDHAEVVALKQAAALGRSTAGCTAYVTLEPCSLHGRTGPCADALIAAGIARCVIATEDANPVVRGQGIAKLRAAGIEVLVGMGRKEAQAINDAFAWSIQHGTPLVTLKSALSVDGYLAPPASTRTRAEPHWLTGAASRAEVQRMRHASDAVLTGIGTVLADDPLLTDRTGLPRRRPLMRVVLDPGLRIPMDSALVRSIADDLWILCTEESERRRPDKFYGLSSRGAIMTELPGGPRLDLNQVLAALAVSEVQSVLLEAGTALNGAFLAAGLVQKVALFFAETELGPGSVPFVSGLSGPFALQQQLHDLQQRTFGPDSCVSGRLARIWPAPLPDTVD